MIKKLSKYGNSFAILIDKPILELLNISEGTQLKIKTDGESIIITPIQSELSKIRKVSENVEVQKAFEEITRTYAPALKKLSEN